MCNQALAKASDNKYVCNPETSRWVLKTGKIGRELIGTKKPTKKCKVEKKFTKLVIGKEWKAEELRDKFLKGLAALIRDEEYFGTITELELGHKKEFMVPLMSDCAMKIVYYPGKIRTTRSKRIIKVLCLLVKNVHGKVRFVVLRNDKRGGLANAIGMIISSSSSSYHEVYRAIISANLIGTVIKQSRKQKQKNVMLVGKKG